MSGAFAVAFIAGCGALAFTIVGGSGAADFAGAFTAGLVATGGLAAIG